MFIEGLCVRVYKCKKLIWSSNGWINWPILRCNLFFNVIYLAIKMNKLLTNTITLLNPKNIMLS